LNTKKILKTQKAIKNIITAKMITNLNLDIIFCQHIKDEIKNPVNAILTDL